ncbi:hypothetical protein [Desulfonatronospira sp.]|uniref:hypothetical protein n=1 Tax=Desulfonatronospira sp. TaxID=1962951 RepID=UPI0025C5B809|nr:hypothetical protein [Desulfonatronospira sp.]
MWNQQMFTFSSFAMDDGDVARFSKTVYPATEFSSHTLQMILGQCFVGAGQLSPPVTKSTSLLPQGKITIENYAIYTVILTFQQALIVLAELICKLHLKPPLNGCFLEYAVKTGKGQMFIKGCPEGASFSAQGRGKSLVSYPLNLVMKNKKI